MPPWGSTAAEHGVAAPPPIPPHAPAPPSCSSLIPRPAFHRSTVTLLETELLSPVRFGPELTHAKRFPHPSP